MIFPIIFVKHSKNFFNIKINDNICPWYSVLPFLTTRNFFRSIWGKTFCKNIFIFCCSYMITNISLRIFISFFYIKVNIYPWLQQAQKGIILFALWYVLLYLLTMSSNLSIYTCFHIEFIYLEILLFKVLLNLSATTDFPALLAYVLKTFLHHYLLTMILSIF